MANYLNEKLKYTQLSLIDEQSNPIMMDWENNIMQESAKVICRNGGDILNIGFGMGIIDNYIQKENFKTHTIIECHSDVIQKMKKDEWFNKINTKVINDKWQNSIKNIGTFDGVYYNTWKDDYLSFIGEVHKIVNTGGIFSFFNTQYYNPNTRSIPRVYYNKLKENFYIDSIQIDINYEDYNIENIDRYWSTSRKKYWVPICTRK